MKLNLLSCFAFILALVIVQGHSLRFKRSDIKYKTDEDLTWEERELILRRGYMQNSVANTQSQTIVGPQGVAHQTAGGSMSGNLANDGSSGQLSAANTQQQMIQSGDRLQSQNSGQSQSANFGKDHQLMSNANTNTNTVQEGANVREQTQGGAASSTMDKHGSQASQAQTTNERYVTDGQQGSRSTGSSQSQNIGKDGSGSGANSNTGVETIVLPDGTVITKSFGSSQSFQSSGNVKVGALASGLSNMMQG